MDITIKGEEYRIGKLDGFTQFHVARRLAPALWALASATGGKPVKDLDTAKAVLAVAPVADVIAHMSDADSNYVLNACLNVCKRKQKEGWQVVLGAPGRFMFEDIDMPVMVQLTVSVVRLNLSNFSDALGI